jgi:hypothetical protein
LSTNRRTVDHRKKIPRFQSIRRAANGRIKAAPQKISKKVCPPAGSGGGFGRLSRHPPPASFQTPPGPDRRRPIQAGPSPRPWQTSPIQGWTESPGPGQTGFLRPAVQETFSILGAVLEPQSRGVLVQTSLNRGMPVGAAGDFHGVRGRHLADDAAFLRHSRDIERPLPVQLFVISAGPIEGLLSAGACAACLFRRSPFKRAARKGSKAGILGR